jgi:hypothetical protein
MLDRSPGRGSWSLSKSVMPPAGDHLSLVRSQSDLTLPRDPVPLALLLHSLDGFRAVGIIA